MYWAVCGVVRSLALQIIRALIADGLTYFLDQGEPVGVIRPPIQHDAIDGP